MTVTTVAEANKRHESKDFFDFQYAVEFWRRAKVPGSFTKEWNPINSAYVEWEELNKTNPKKATEMLLSSTDKGEKIRKGHDLYKVWDIWLKGYKQYRTIPAMPWNYTGPYKTNACYHMRKTNIFTNSCEDYPDWRNAANRKADEKAVAKTFERHVKWHSHIAKTVQTIKGASEEGHN